MVISAAARAATKILARAKTIRSKPKAKKVKKVPHDHHVTAQKNVIKKRAVDVVKTSKNLSDVKAREGNTGEVFVGGFKVRSVSGADSTKLKIKKRKFNN